MKQKIIRYAVMIVALGVFIYSAYQLTLIYIESKESMEVYDEVKNMFISDASDQEIQTDEQGMTIANNNSGGQFVWDTDTYLENEDVEISRKGIESPYGYFLQNIDAAYKIGRAHV